TKVVFAGGCCANGPGDQLPQATVDIYDTQTGTWSIALLSQPRSSLAAATVGTKILFAGGVNPYDATPSNVVDIFDTQTGIWSTAVLSQARWSLAGTALN